MRLIKNQIYVRIVSFIICFVFLLENIAYGIDLSKLRIPLICDADEAFMPSPKDLPNMIVSARIIAYQGEYDKFNKLAQEILKLINNNKADDTVKTKGPAIVSELARIYLNYGKLEESERIIDIGRKIFKDNLNVAAESIYLYRRSGEIDKAIKAGKHALEIMNTMRENTKTQELLHKQEPHVLINLANSYIDHGLMKEAIDILEDGVNRYPEYIYIRNTLAAAYLKDRQYEYAGYVLDKTMELIEQFKLDDNKKQQAVKAEAYARDIKANLLFRIGEVDKAIQLGIENHKMFPDDIIILINLIVFLTNNGEYQKADTFVDEVTKLLEKLKSMPGGIMALKDVEYSVVNRAAEVKINVGDIDTAALMAEDILGRYPDDVGMRKMVTEILLKAADRCIFNKDIEKAHYIYKVLKTLIPMSDRTYSSINLKFLQSDRVYSAVKQGMKIGCNAEGQLYSLAYKLKERGFTELSAFISSNQFNVKIVANNINSMGLGVQSEEDAYGCIPYSDMAVNEKGIDYITPAQIAKGSDAVIPVYIGTLWYSLTNIEQQELLLDLISSFYADINNKEKESITLIGVERDEPKALSNGIPAKILINDKEMENIGNAVLEADNQIIGINSTYSHAGPGIFSFCVNNDSPKGPVRITEVQLLSSGIRIPVFLLLKELEAVGKSFGSYIDARKELFAVCEAIGIKPEDLEKDLASPLSSQKFMTHSKKIQGLFSEDDLKALNGRLEEAFEDITKRKQLISENKINVIKQAILENYRYICSLYTMLDSMNINLSGTAEDKVKIASEQYAQLSDSMAKEPYMPRAASYIGKLGNMINSGQMDMQEAGGLITDIKFNIALDANDRLAQELSRHVPFDKVDEIIRQTAFLLEAQQDIYRFRDIVRSKKNQELSPEEKNVMEDYLRRVVSHKVSYQCGIQCRDNLYKIQNPHLPVEKICPHIEGMSKALPYLGWGVSDNDGNFKFIRGSADVADDSVLYDYTSLLENIGPSEDIYFGIRVFDDNALPNEDALEEFYRHYRDIKSLTGGRELYLWVVANKKSRIYKFDGSLKEVSVEFPDIKEPAVDISSSLIFRKGTTPRLKIDTLPGNIKSGIVSGIDNSANRGFTEEGDTMISPDGMLRWIIYNPNDPEMIMVNPVVSTVVSYPNGEGKLSMPYDNLSTWATVPRRQEKGAVFSQFNGDSIIQEVDKGARVQDLGNIAWSKLDVWREKIYPLRPLAGVFRETDQNKSGFISKVITYWKTPVKWDKEFSLSAEEMDAIEQIEPLKSRMIDEGVPYDAIKSAEKAMDIELRLWILMSMMDLASSCIGATQDEIDLKVVGGEDFIVRVEELLQMVEALDLTEDLGREIKGLSEAIEKDYILPRNKFEEFRGYANKFIGFNMAWRIAEWSATKYNEFIGAEISSNFKDLACLKSASLFECRSALEQGLIAMRFISWHRSMAFSDALEANSLDIINEKAPITDIAVKIDGKSRSAGEALYDRYKALDIEISPCRNILGILLKSGGVLRSVGGECLEGSSMRLPYHRLNDMIRRYGCDELIFISSGIYNNMPRGTIINLARRFAREAGMPEDKISFMMVEAPQTLPAISERASVRDKDFDTAGIRYFSIIPPKDTLERDKNIVFMGMVLELFVKQITNDVMDSGDSSLNESIDFIKRVNAEDLLSIGKKYFNYTEKNFASESAIKRLQNEILVSGRVGEFTAEILKNRSSRRPTMYDCVRNMIRDGADCTINYINDNIKPQDINRIKSAIYKQRDSALNEIDRRIKALLKNESETAFSIKVILTPDTALEALNLNIIVRQNEIFNSFIRYLKMVVESSAIEKGLANGDRVLEEVDVKKVFGVKEESDTDSTDAIVIPDDVKEITSQFKGLEIGSDKASIRTASVNGFSKQGELGTVELDSQIVSIIEAISRAGKYGKNGILIHRQAGQGKVIFSQNRAFRDSFQADCGLNPWFLAQINPCIANEAGNRVQYSRQVDEIKEDMMPKQIISISDALETADPNLKTFDVNSAYAKDILNASRINDVIDPEVIKEGIKNVRQKLAKALKTSVDIDSVITSFANMSMEYDGLIGEARLYSRKLASAARDEKQKIYEYVRAFGEDEEIADPEYLKREEFSAVCNFNRHIQTDMKDRYIKLTQALKKIRDDNFSETEEPYKHLTRLIEAYEKPENWKEFIQLNEFRSILENSVSPEKADKVMPQYITACSDWMFLDKDGKAVLLRHLDEIIASLKKVDESLSYDLNNFKNRIQMTEKVSVDIYGYLLDTAMTILADYYVYSNADFLNGIKSVLKKNNAPIEVINSIDSITGTKLSNKEDIIRMFFLVISLIQEDEKHKAMLFLNAEFPDANYTYTDRAEIYSILKQPVKMLGSLYLWQYGIQHGVREAVEQVNDNGQIKWVIKDKDAFIEGAHKIWISTLDLYRRNQEVNAMRSLGSEKEEQVNINLSDIAAPNLKGIGVIGVSSLSGVKFYDLPRIQHTSFVDGVKYDKTELVEALTKDKEMSFVILEKSFTNDAEMDVNDMFTLYNLSVELSIAAGRAVPVSMVVFSSSGDKWQRYSFNPDTAPAIASGEMSKGLSAYMWFTSDFFKEVNIAIEGELASGKTYSDDLLKEVYLKCIKDALERHYPDKKARIEDFMYQCSKAIEDIPNTLGRERVEPLIQIAAAIFFRQFCVKDIMDKGIVVPCDINMSIKGIPLNHIPTGPVTKIEQLIMYQKEIKARVADIGRMGKAINRDNALDILFGKANSDKILNSVYLSSLVAIRPLINEAVLMDRDISEVSSLLTQKDKQGRSILNLTLLPYISGLPLWKGTACDFAISAILAPTHFLRRAVLANADMLTKEGGDLVNVSSMEFIEKMWGMLDDAGLLPVKQEIETNLKKEFGDMPLQDIFSYHRDSVLFIIRDVCRNVSNNSGANLTGKAALTDLYESIKSNNELRDKYFTFIKKIAEQYDIKLPEPGLKDIQKRVDSWFRSPKAEEYREKIIKELRETLGMSSGEVKSILNELDAGFPYDNMQEVREELVFRIAKRVREFNQAFKAGIEPIDEDVFEDDVVRRELGLLPMDLEDKTKETMKLLIAFLGDLSEIRTLDDYKDIPEVKALNKYKDRLEKIDSLTAKDLIAEYDKFTEHAYEEIKKNEAEDASGYGNPKDSISDFENRACDLNPTDTWYVDTSESYNKASKALVVLRASKYKTGLKGRLDVSKKLFDDREEVDKFIEDVRQDIQKQNNEDVIYNLDMVIKARTKISEIQNEDVKTFLNKRLDDVLRDRVSVIYRYREFQKDNPDFIPEAKELIIKYNLSMSLSEFWRRYNMLTTEDVISIRDSSASRDDALSKLDARCKEIINIKTIEDLKQEVRNAELQNRRFDASLYCFEIMLITADNVERKNYYTKARENIRAFLKTQELDTILDVITQHEENMENEKGYLRVIYLCIETVNIFVQAGRFDDAKKCLDKAESINMKLLQENRLLEEINISKERVAVFIDVREISLELNNVKTIIEYNDLIEKADNLLAKLDEKDRDFITTQTDYTKNKAQALNRLSTGIDKLKNALLGTPLEKEIADIIDELLNVPYDFKINIENIGKPYLSMPLVSDELISIQAQKGDNIPIVTIRIIWPDANGAVKQSDVNKGANTIDVIIPMENGRPPSLKEVRDMVFNCFVDEYLWPLLEKDMIAIDEALGEASNKRDGFRIDYLYAKAENLKKLHKYQDALDSCLNAAELCSNGDCNSINNIGTINELSQELNNIMDEKTRGLKEQEIQVTKELEIINKLNELKDAFENVKTREEYEELVSYELENKRIYYSGVDMLLAGVFNLYEITDKDEILRISYGISINDVISNANNRINGDAEKKLRDCTDRIVDSKNDIVKVDSKDLRDIDILEGEAIEAVENMWKTPFIMGIENGDEENIEYHIKQIEKFDTQKHKWELVLSCKALLKTYGMFVKEIKIVNKGEVRNAIGDGYVGENQKMAFSDNILYVNLSNINLESQIKDMPSEDLFQGVELLCQILPKRLKTVYLPVDTIRSILMGVAKGTYDSTNNNFKMPMDIQECGDLPNSGPVILQDTEDGQGVIVKLNVSSQDWKILGIDANKWDIEVIKAVRLYKDPRSAKREELRKRKTNANTNI